MSVGKEKVPLEKLEEVVESIDFLSHQLSLPEGSIIQDPERGTKYRVHRLLTLYGWQLPYRIYEVSAEEEGAQTKQPNESFLSSFWLWEATSPDVVTLLQREAEILIQLNMSMLPKAYSRFQHDERFYLVTETLPEQTLKEAMERKELSFPEFLTVLSQVAYTLTQIHESGLVHLGLRPQSVLLGKPIKLVDFRWTVRIGEKPQNPFYHSGYSPPELLETKESIDERADVFAVGALLYHFINNQPIPETGVQLAGWQCPYSGAPQILHRCLGPKEERYHNMYVLHQELLRLKQRYMPSTIYTVVGATTIGLEPSRTTNQDAYGYLEGTMQMEAGSVKWLIACVADGMGGMESGEIASETAVKTILAEAATALSMNPSLSPEDQVRFLKEWVHKANEKVCTALAQRRTRGGTTLLCCLFLGKQLAIAHVGDCRLYLVRNGEITLLTRDHSLAMALALQEGKMDMEALRHHPDRSRLTRSLGDRSPLPYYFVDSLETTTDKPTMELQDGDILLLCSDGLWEPVIESEMVSVLEQHPNSLLEAAQKLLGIALHQGAPDNTTVLLVKLKEVLPIELNQSIGGGEDVKHRVETSSSSS